MASKSPTGDKVKSKTKKKIAVKKSAKPAAKKAMVKKAPAKKAPAKKVAKKAAKPVVKYDYFSKLTGKPVTERYYISHPELVRRKKVVPKVKAAKKSAKKTVATALAKVKKQVLKSPAKFAGLPPLMEQKYVDGLESRKSYLVIARKDEKTMATIRWITDAEIRVHLFPEVQAIFDNAPGNWKYRSANMSGQRYHTKWMNKAKLKELHDALLQVPEFRVMPWDHLLTVCPRGFLANYQDVTA